MAEDDDTQGKPREVTGDSDHPQHRVAPGEGNTAPLVSEGADHPEFSIFDGAGNESVVVLAPDEDGRTSEGTGPTSEAAMADAKKPGKVLGEAFHPK